MSRVLLIFGLCALAACAADPATTTPTTTPTTTGPTTTATPSVAPPPTTAPVFAEVRVEVSPDAAYLVDEEGRSLYLFTLDDSRTSSCTGPCAETWPPLLGDPVAGEGVDQDLLGNAERAGGAIQVTYAGRPLYTYTADVAPGDVNGHGFNDVWFLVRPDGDALTGSP